MHLSLDCAVVLYIEHTCTIILIVSLLYCTFILIGIGTFSFSVFGLGGPWPIEMPCDLLNGNYNGKAYKLCS